MGLAYVMARSTAPAPYRGQKKKRLEEVSHQECSSLMSLDAKRTPRADQTWAELHEALHKRNLSSPRHSTMSNHSSSLELPDSYHSSSFQGLKPSLLVKKLAKNCMSPVLFEFFPFFRQPTSLVFLVRGLSPRLHQPLAEDGAPATGSTMQRVFGLVFCWFSPLPTCPH